MNAPPLLRRPAGVLLALAIAAGVGASAYATASSQTTKRQCTDSRTVVSVEQRAALPNAKGASHAVRTSKQVCTSCAEPTTVMKPSLPNGRGAMVAVSVPGTHACGDCR